MTSFILTEVIQEPLSAMARSLSAADCQWPAAWVTAVSSPEAAIGPLVQRSEVPRPPYCAVRCPRTFDAPNVGAGPCEMTVHNHRNRIRPARLPVTVATTRAGAAALASEVIMMHPSARRCLVESEFPSGHKHRVPLVSGCCSAIARTRHNQGRNTAAQPLLGTLVPPISSHSPVEGS